MKKYQELNASENLVCPHLWDAAKAVLRGKCIALNTHIRQEEKPLSTAELPTSKEKVRIKINPKQVESITLEKENTENRWIRGLFFKEEIQLTEL